MSNRDQTTTRRQHHVWRSYLEAWATNGKIFCQQGAKIFNSNVINVAVERDFYKLPDLTNKDVLFIRDIMKDSPTSAKEVIENFITMFGMFGRLRASLLKAGRKASLPSLERAIIIGEESFHARIESGAKPILDAIRRKDLSFYDDPDLCGKFAHFINLQNLRTKGVQERLFANTIEQDGISLKRVWPVLRQAMAVNAGGRLLLERKIRPLILLENETEIPFITADQPVINLLGPHAGEPPRLVALYYPVTPQLAIIWDEVTERTGYAAGPVSADQALALNRTIRAKSFSQVFGNSRNVLESLCVEQPGA